MLISKKHTVDSIKEIAHQNHMQSLQKFLFRYERYLAYLGWSVFVLVALLHMWKVNGGFITNYGADIFAPIMLYYSARTNKTLLSKLFKRTPNEIQTFLNTMVSLCFMGNCSKI